MTTAVAPAPLSHPVSDRRTRAALVTLVIGAVLLALGRILATNGGSPADRLHQMSGHDAQVTAGSLLAIAGFCALVPGFLAVAGLVRARGATLATIGGALVVVGSVGFSVLVAVDISTLAATHVSPAAPMQDYLHQLDVAPGMLVISPLAVLGYFFGPFLITLGARRAALVPAWLPWGVLVSLVLQPVGVGLGGPGLAHVVDALCQLAFVAMTVLLARSILNRTA